MVNPSRLSFATIWKQIAIYHYITAGMRIRHQTLYKMQDFAQGAAIFFLKIC